MTDQPINNITNDLGRELREAEKLEKGLSRMFESLQPPFASAQSLLAQLGDGGFHESQLTLDDAGPYSFEEAAAQAQVKSQDKAAGSDLLAAGLEEQAIEDGESEDE